MKMYCDNTPSKADVTTMIKAHTRKLFLASVATSIVVSIVVSSFISFIK